MNDSLVIILNMAIHFMFNQTWIVNSQNHTLVFEEEVSVSPGIVPGTAGALEASSRYAVSSSKNISSPRASNSKNYFEIEKKFISICI